MARQTFVLRNGELILKAQDGVLTEEYLNLPHETQSALHGFGRDTLGEGVQGVLCHADGKKYDSKSEYNRAVRAAGCVVVGNDYNKAEWKPPIERGIKGDFNVRPQLKEAIERVGNGRSNSRY